MFLLVALDLTKCRNLSGVDRFFSGNFCQPYLAGDVSLCGGGHSRPPGDASMGCAPFVSPYIQTTDLEDGTDASITVLYGGRTSGCSHEIRNQSKGSSSE